MATDQIEPDLKKLSEDIRKNLGKMGNYKGKSKRKAMLVAVGGAGVNVGMVVLVGEETAVDVGDGVAGG